MTYKKTDSGVLLNPENGRINVDEVDTFENILRKNIDKNNELTINMKNVLVICSAGLGKLFKLCGEGVKITVCNLCEYIMKMFRMLHLHYIFTIK